MITVVAWRPGWSAAQWLSIPAAVAFLAGMADVYLQRTVPVWNTWRTPLAFFTTAIVLGALGGLTLLIGLGRVDTGWFLGNVWIVGLFVIAVGQQLRRRRAYYSGYERIGV